MSEHGAVHGTAMAPELKNAQDVRAYIKERMETYKFRGSPQKFLPRSALDAITEQAVIQRIVKQDLVLVFNNYTEEELVNRIRDIRNRGRKLFAICLYCHKTINYVMIMLQDGITDDSLPLEDVDFGSLSEQEDFVNTFVNAQKYFETWDRFSIPIRFEKNDATFKGKGAFGKVFQVKIHPDQHSFNALMSKEDMFAMKITNNNETTRGGREQNFHLGMAGQEHPHLVKCRASFTLGSRYHMIYDLAYSDLERFIRVNSVASKNVELSASWIAQQLAGLAGAVKAVHNPAGSQQPTASNTLGVPSQHLEKTGYIHDIKPENILVFETRDGSYMLKLSDFSCARVAEYIATISGKRDRYKTKRMSGTAEYRAPESLNNETSRPYDMWSLGCVFLEILVWYVHGYDELESFRDSRTGPIFPHGSEDEGFWHKTELGIIELRKPVVRMISDLQERCTGDLKDIVDAIPQLLQIDPIKRPKALDLEQQLSRLGTGSTVRRSSSLVNGGYPASLSASNPTPRLQKRSDSGSSFGENVIVTRPSDDSERKISAFKV